MKRNQMTLKADNSSKKRVAHAVGVLAALMLAGILLVWHMRQEKTALAGDAVGTSRAGEDVPIAEEYIPDGHGALPGSREDGAYGVYNVYNIEEILSAGSDEITVEAEDAGEGFSYGIKDYSVSLYGGEALSYPFSAQELMDSSGMPLCYISYSQIETAYVVLYPKEANVKENANVILSYGKEEEDLLNAVPDSVQFVGIQEKGEGFVEMNGIDLSGGDALGRLAGGKCSGYSGRVFPWKDGGSIRYLRFSDKDSGDGMDAQVILYPDGRTQLYSLSVFYQ